MIIKPKLKQLTGTLQKISSWKSKEMFTKEKWRIMIINTVCDPGLHPVPGKKKVAAKDIIGTIDKLKYGL